MIAIKTLRIMPYRCLECMFLNRIEEPLFHINLGECKAFCVDDNIFKNTTVNDMFTRRPEWCPLIEVEDED